MIQQNTINQMRTDLNAQQMLILVYGLMEIHRAQTLEMQNGGALLTNGINALIQLVQTHDDFQSLCIKMPTLELQLQFIMAMKAQKPASVPLDFQFIKQLGKLRRRWHSWLQKHRSRNAVCKIMELITLFGRRIFWRIATIG